MHEFYGDLLIGGTRLRHLHGELETDQRVAGTTDWMLAGRLIVGPPDTELLQSGRPYRLLLEDGRAGQVVVSKMKSQGEDSIVVEFEPRPVPIKPR